MLLSSAANTGVLKRLNASIDLPSVVGAPLLILTERDLIDYAGGKNVGFIIAGNTFVFLKMIGILNIAETGVGIAPKVYVFRVCVSQLVSEAPGRSPF